MKRNTTEREREREREKREKRREKKTDQKMKKIKKQRPKKSRKSNRRARSTAHFLLFFSEFLGEERKEDALIFITRDTEDTRAKKRSHKTTLFTETGSRRTGRGDSWRAILKNSEALKKDR